MTKQLLQGIVFYSVSYIILSLLFGATIDTFFPKFNKSKNKGLILCEIILQTITIIYISYFIESLSEVIKKSMNLKISSYGTDNILSIVFITTQDNYIKKINHLQKSILQSI